MDVTLFPVRVFPSMGGYDELTIVSSSSSSSPGLLLATPDQSKWLHVNSGRIEFSAERAPAQALEIVPSGRKKQVWNLRISNQLIRFNRAGELSLSDPHFMPDPTCDFYLFSTSAQSFEQWLRDRTPKKRAKVTESEQVTAEFPNEEIIWAPEEQVDTAEMFNASWWALMGLLIGLFVIVFFALIFSIRSQYKRRKQDKARFIITVSAKEEEESVPIEQSELE